MTPPDDREPPSDLARVQHFMATADDYEQLDIVFPLLAAGVALGERTDHYARWVIVMHGAILRKYYQRGDKLHLNRVVTSLRAVVPEDPSKAAAWEYLLTELSQIESLGEHVYAGQASRGEMEVLEHELYGRHLHGDYGKWARRVPDSSGAWALHMAVSAQARRVRYLAQLVRDHVERGLLDLGEPDS